MQSKMFHHLLAFVLGIIVTLINVHLFHDKPSDEVVKDEQYIIRDLTGEDVAVNPVK